MALFFNYHDQYRDVGGDIVAGGDFERSPLTEGGASLSGHWRERGQLIRWEPQGGFDSSGGVQLGTRGGRGSSLNYTINNPRAIQFLRLSGRLRTDEIVVGEQGWNTARLFLSFTDRDGRREPHDVCAITGTQPWQHCERVVPVPDTTVTAQVRVLNLAESGTLWVDDIHLTAAEEKPSALFLRALFATLWCGVLAYCAWTVRLWRQPFGPAIIAIGLLVIAGVTAPESTIEWIVHSGANAANGLVNEDTANVINASSVQSPPSPDVAIAPSVRGAARSLLVPFDTVFMVKKTGHFVLFGLLAFVAFSSTLRRWRSEPSASRPAAAVATVGVALLLFAAGAEVLQFLTITRGPSVIDWAIDASGVLLGAMFALIAHRVARSAVAPGRTG